MLPVERATGVEQRVCLGAGPTFHTSVPIISAVIDLCMRGDASERSHTNPGLIGDEPLQTSEADKISEPAGNIGVVTIHNRKHQPIVVVELKTKET